MICSKVLGTRQINVFLIVTLLVLISACSFKTLYNRLDSLIPNYIEGMVSLDDVLEKKVEQRTELLIRWHRNTQLKDYAAWLQTLQHDVGTHSTEERLLQHIDKLDSFWQLLSQKLNEEMAILLPLLNSEQRKELFANIAEKNEKFREDYIELDEKERIDSFAETLQDNYENWLGELTDEQEKAIERAASELHSVAPLRLEQRLQWQRGIENILDGNETTSLKSERLRLFFSAFDMNDNAEIKSAAAVNRRIIVQLTVNIAHVLAPEQKNYFIGKTNNYIRMFTELAENR